MKVEEQDFFRKFNSIIPAVICHSSLKHIKRRKYAESSSHLEHRIYLTGKSNKLNTKIIILISQE